MLNLEKRMVSSIELFNLKGKRALITGSSQGIGFTLAKGLSCEHVIASTLPIRSEYLRSSIAILVEPWDSILAFEA